MNANTNMRDPAWDKGRRACTLAMHPGDDEECGFGLVYNGVKYGANVNRSTKNTCPDRIAATPLYRYVPRRIEAV